MLLIPESSRIDAGKYEITLENSAGKKSADIYVRVLDSPGPPLNLKPVKIDKESITLQWDSPLIDGGAKITNYIIEKRESTRKAFATAITKCPTTSVTIDDLGEGCEYYFRVSVPYVARPKAAVNWVKDGQPLKRTTRVNFNNTPTKAYISVKESKLSDGGQYTLLLKNPGGEKATQINVEPDLDIDPELRKIVSIKAGTSLRLFIPIKGRPSPTIKWDKDEETLKETAQVEITSSYTSLVIDKMSRNDSGKYTVTAQNSSGTKSAFVVVRVL
uniref:Titin n=1 Tax=Poecilia reticulata TaxID=8081 RepID=A0A3P9PWF6_POERE